jgi:hypothetical protein
MLVLRRITITRARRIFPGILAGTQRDSMESNRNTGFKYLNSRNLHNISTELGKGELSMDAPVYIVWGAGTDVGKTLISAGICYAASQISVGCCFPYIVFIICIQISLYSSNVIFAGRCAGILLQTSANWISRRFRF